MTNRKRYLGGSLAVLLLLLLTLLALSWAPDQEVDQLKPRWAQAPSVFLPVDGMQVHVRDEGPREDPLPIVLLHGTSASLHTWEGWAQSLKAEHRVIRFDLPGFGLTGPFPDADYRVGHYTRFVRDMLDTLGVKKVILAGNSFGGELAWETALAYPERVEKLILVDAAGYPRDATSVPIGFRLAQMPVLNHIMPFLLPRSVVESSVRNVYGDPAKVTPELVDLYYDITRREGNRAALTQRVRQWDNSPAAADRIRQVQQPTLIMWGQKDRLILPANALRFHEDIKSSQLVIFDELGHVPQEESPAATVAAVKNFLAN